MRCRPQSIRTRFTALVAHRQASRIASVVVWPPAHKVECPGRKWNVRSGAFGAVAELWTWAGEEQDNWYENLAYVSEVNFQELSVQFAENRRLDKRSADYYLDPRVFERGLRVLFASK